MAIKYWLGGTPAAAQVASASIDSVDGTPADNDFTLTIGTQAVTVAGDTDVATTAAALVAALEASALDYIARVTWTNPSGGDIVATADVAGVPFVAALSVSGGGSGTVTDFSDDTPSSGPTDYSTAANWSGGAIPVNGDSVRVGNTPWNITYGLEQSGVALTEFWVQDSYEGLIGLDARGFATDKNGETLLSTSLEYRPDYLEIASDVVRIEGGSARCKIDNQESAASLCTVASRATSSLDTPLQAVRYKAAHASAQAFIKKATAGCGIAEEPQDSATFSNIWMQSKVATDQIRIGRGTTLTNYWHFGGDGKVSLAGTLTSLLQEGGTLQTDGFWSVTGAVVRGGTLEFNNEHATEGVVCTTLTAEKAGYVDLTAQTHLRVITNLQLQAGGSALWSSDCLTMTNILAPTGRTLVSCAAA